MDISVKRELVEPQYVAEPYPTSVTEASLRRPESVIELSSSSSSSGSDSDSDGVPRLLANGTVSSNSGGAGSPSAVVLPVGFLKPLRKETPLPLPQLESVCQFDATSKENDDAGSSVKVSGQSCKQFWKAGDYEGDPATSWTASSAGMDHVRVHPKFLHSNATSHKWALGAFAELLDNALDEVCNGATHVNVDMLVSKKDNSRMLLVEDNGGGMDPDKIRRCMSLGYSVKSKMANTIGQYGNGFKTSTMRLGADVIVFSRCQRKNNSPTQSIGFLSYTFLRSTGKEDIVVPMLDYERKGQDWNKLIRTSTEDWNTNLETIAEWSPFSSEVDLVQQFDLMRDQGTRIIIYNLWEDDQGQLELDFDADPHDIQIRGVNREEKNIEMAKEFPNSRHFLTYRHSLRSYASVLYLRIPAGFRIILRGKDVDHHNIVNDMMFSQEITYRPQSGADGVLKDSDMVAVVTIGFVKDAKHHIDVSGFNVYHKNRLIKPFWRLWNPAGSGGRGVIGLLEADFVAPAHDKQSFERTTVLSRLETRLIQMQKSYWSLNCHKIGYVSNRSRKAADASIDEDFSPSKAKYAVSTSKGTPSSSDKLYSHSNLKKKGKESDTFSKYEKTMLDKSNKRRKESCLEPSLPSDSDGDDIYVMSPKRQSNGKTNNISSPEYSGRRGTIRTRSMYSEDTNTSGGNTIPATGGSQLQANAINGPVLSESDLQTLEILKQENQKLKERLQMEEADLLGELLQDLQHQKDKCQSLEAQLQVAQQKIEELNKEQESLIDIFSEERDRRDAEERNLRKKLQEAFSTIQELLEKVKLLERTKLASAKQGR